MPIRVIVFLTISVFLWTCEAPRNNPLDPLNPERKFESIKGQVLTLSVPHTPIFGVTVYSEDEQLLLVTDANGNFSADDIQPLNHWLHFSCDGYLNDSLYLDFNSNTQNNYSIYLNAKPQLTNLKFYSTIVNTDGGYQNHYLSFQAQINDVDNDIDSVFIENISIDYSDQITFNTLTKTFELSVISLSNLDISSIEQIIGQPFDIRVIDSFGHSIIIEQAYIHRIIRDEVELKSPIGSAIVSTSPLLSWKPINPGFTFTYSIEIQTDESDKRLVWETEGLEPTTASFQVDSELPTSPINEYIWAIWVIDNYGNRVRTNYHKFQVE